MNKHQLCAYATFKDDCTTKLGYISEIKINDDGNIIYTILTKNKAYIVDEKDIYSSRVSAMNYVNKIIEIKKEIKL